MHFRKLVAIVFREFVSQNLERPVQDVNSPNILWYSQYIRSLSAGRGALTGTVNCIFEILFRQYPKSTEVKDLVPGWIRCGMPLVNLLFLENKNVRISHSTSLKKMFILTTSDVLIGELDHPPMYFS